MKYLLMIYMNPTVWDKLDDAARQEVFDGHEGFIKMITTSSTPRRGTAPSNWPR